MNLEVLHKRMRDTMDWRKFYANRQIVTDGEPDAEGWAKVLDVENLSLVRINVKSGAWEDRDGAKGNVYEFARTRKDYSEGDPGDLEILEDLCQEAGVPTNDPEPEPAEAEPDEDPESYVADTDLRRWERRLTTPRRDYLRDLTGLTPETAKRYSIGWTPGWKRVRPSFVLPVHDPDTVCRSIRLVDDSFQSRWVMRPIYGIARPQFTPRLYGLDEMIQGKWSTVLLCDSEFERLIVMQERQREDWGAVSLTDRAFPREWAPHFDGKDVILCPTPERTSLSCFERIVGPALHEALKAGRLKSLKIMRYEAAAGQTRPTLNRWFQCGGTWAEFHRLALLAVPFVPANALAESEQSIELKELSEIDDPKHGDRRVRVPLTISGDSDLVFDSPSAFRVDYCAEIYKGNCALCENKTFDLPPGRPEHIGMCGQSEVQKESVLRGICCPYGKRPHLQTLGKYAFREVYATTYQRRVIRGAENDQARVQRTAERTIYVRIPDGESGPLEPRGYYATGWVRTNPRNSYRTLLVESLEPIREGFEDFRAVEYQESFDRLRALGWQGICNDLTTHRTRIQDQQEALLVVMLTYCSVLRIRFNGETIRGWVASALIGDSGTGKSTNFERIAESAGEGEIFQCLTGKRTGLTYAVNRSEYNWRCRAGLFPQNTRKILCIEEAQDMEARDIKSMAGALDDQGVLRVETIARGHYEAMTRLVINCNPKDGRTLASYTFGCQSIADLFDAMFVRRLDLAAFLRRSDEHAKYNREDVSLDAGEAKVRPEDLRALIHFAWSREADAIYFGKETTAEVLAAAGRLAERFGWCDDIPLVCPSDVRKSIARLAAAWAVLDMSVDENLWSVTVKPEHVSLTEKLLNALYSHPDCALDRYSEQAHRSGNLEDYPAIEKELETRLNAGIAELVQGRLPLGRTLALLLTGVQAKRSELRRASGASDGGITDILAFLTSHHLIRSNRNGQFAPTPKFGRVMARISERLPELYGLIGMSQADEGLHEQP